jgi:NAD(P)-dependent dehydrogenase (short-subunit alcohol dehydrogenase family)
MTSSGSSNKRVVLISGGASGIGRCMAEAFLGDGCAVHVCDTSAENIAEFLNANSGATATAADVSDTQQVEQVFEDLVEKHGQLNILINNAGIAGPTGGVADIEVADWDQCIGIDLNGSFYMTRLAVPLLKKAGGGSIINIASTAALHGYPLRSPYAAAKWAQIGLTRTWAMELGTSNIRVNAICPGSVSGPRIESVIERDAANRGMSPDQIRDTYLRQTSLRTFVSADDVANMAVFLASDKAGKVSGQSIAVDGHTEGLSNWLD